MGKRQAGDSFLSGAGLEEGSSRGCRKGTRPHLNPTPWGTKVQVSGEGAADLTEHKGKPAKGPEKGPNTNPPSWGGEVNRARSRSYANTVEGLAHKVLPKTQAEFGSHREEGLHQLERPRPNTLAHRPA